MRRVEKKTIFITTLNNRHAACGGNISTHGVHIARSSPYGRKQKKNWRNRFMPHTYSNSRDKINLAANG